MEERNRKRFPFISADAFVSPTDKLALDNIKSMPILPLLVRKLNEWAIDHIVHERDAAESIRCSEEQFPTLYALLKEACLIMDVPQPTLYVRYSNTYNAYTSGVAQTYIVLHSALINDFSDEEILFILGHELGHIKCGHVLYQMVARFLIPLLEEIGQMTLGLGKLAGIGLVMGFLEWMRQAEYSCDRAGALVLQDAESSLRTIMKLGGGSTRFDSEMNLDAFLQQSRDHADTSGLKGVSKTILFLLYTWQLDHPQVVYREKGLEEWLRTGNYGAILQGNYAMDMGGGSQMGPQVVCRKCGYTVSSVIRYCPKCGEDVQAPPQTQNKHCPHCNIDLPPDVRFCAHCGNRV
jgi:Zn-dependent protease with chaperone function